MIIKEYLVNEIAREKLITKISSFSRGRIKQERARKVIQELDNSLGLNYRSKNSQLQLRILLESLELTQKQIQEVKDQIEKQSQNFLEEMNYLTSIKGVSAYLASVILSEIGDISRFKNKDSLTAFAGLDPSVKQSGKYLRKQGNHISKRGSKYLRRQLYYAAKTAIIFDPELKSYYLRKKSQGKHYNVIMCAVARKILMRVYAVLKQKRLYELRTS